MSRTETDTADANGDTAAYFEANAAPAGSGLYYACLFAEPRYRPQVLALHTLENELIRSLTSVQDPGVARLRLEWWCEEIQRAGSAAARHPLGRKLQPYILEGNPDPAALIRAIQALEGELTARNADDFDNLQQQYRDHFGPFWRLLATSCDISDSTALETAAGLGGLHHMCRALQDLPRGLGQGDCRSLPRAELETAGLAAETLATSPGASDFLLRQVSRLRGQMEQAWLNYPAAFAPRLLHCLILIRLDAVLLREIERDNARLLERTYSLTPLRRLWLAWRTRRHVLRQAR